MNDVEMQSGATSGASALLQNAIILEILEWLDYESAKNQLLKIGIDFDISAPCMLIRVSINDITDFENSHEQFRCLVVTENAFLSGLKSISSCIHASTPDKDILFLVKPFEGKNITKEFLSSIQNKTFKNYGISTNIIFSGMIYFTDFHEMNSTMECIENKLKIEGSRMAIKDSRLYSSSDLEYNASSFEITKLEELFFKAVESGENGVLMNMIESVLDGDYSVSEKLEFYHSLSSCMISYMKTHHIDDIFLNQKRYLDALCGYSESDDLSSVLKDIVEDICLRSSKTEMKNMDDKLIMDINNFIRANITTPLNLTTVASEFSMNPSYLSRFYKSKAGHNISVTIAEYRIAKAKRLLLDPSLRISEIAYETGFDSSSYFSRAFRKSEGMSPAEWRDQHIG